MGYLSEICGIWFGSENIVPKDMDKAAEIRILQQAIGFANENPNSIAS